MCQRHGPNLRACTQHARTSSPFGVCIHTFMCVRARVFVCVCVCVYVMSFPRAAARFSRAYNSSQQSTTTRKPCALRKT